MNPIYDRMLMPWAQAQEQKVAAMDRFNRSRRFIPGAELEPGIGEGANAPLLADSFGEMAPTGPKFEGAMPPPAPMPSAAPAAPAAPAGPAAPPAFNARKFADTMRMLRGGQGGPPPNLIMNDPGRGDYMRPIIPQRGGFVRGRGQPPTRPFWGAPDDLHSPFAGIRIPGSNAMRYRGAMAPGAPAGAEGGGRGAGDGKLEALVALAESGAIPQEALPGLLIQSLGLNFEDPAEKAYKLSRRSVEDAKKDELANLTIAEAKRKAELESKKDEYELDPSKRPLSEREKVELEILKTKAGNEQTLFNKQIEGIDLENEGKRNKLAGKLSPTEQIEIDLKKENLRKVKAETDLLVTGDLTPQEKRTQQAKALEMAENEYQAAFAETLDHVKSKAIAIDRVNDRLSKQGLPLITDFTPRGDPAAAKARVMSGALSGRDPREVFKGALSSVVRNDPKQMSMIGRRKLRDADDKWVFGTKPSEDAEYQTTMMDQIVNELVNEGLNPALAQHLYQQFRFR